MAQADGTVLTDRDATVANVRRAVTEAVQKAGPDDLLVFFYSGHGDRVRRTTAQSTDPDGYDETLSLYDAELADDAFNELLSASRARVTLVVLDSCFSGGFSKDVISAPGRMGLFSSHEDVTSGVARKFRAGGYLAHFFVEAAGDGQAECFVGVHHAPPLLSVTGRAAVVCSAHCNGAASVVCRARVAWTWSR